MDVAFFSKAIVSHDEMMPTSAMAAVDPGVGGSSVLGACAAGRSLLAPALAVDGPILAIDLPLGATEAIASRGSS